MTTYKSKKNRKRNPKVKEEVEESWKKCLLKNAKEEAEESWKKQYDEKKGETAREGKKENPAR